MKKILIYSSLLIFASCASLEEANKVLRNEKIKTTDEFLVKKREPLIFPPDYDKIPEPGSKAKNIDKEEGIKKILKVPKEKISNKNSSTSVEESILKKIRK